MVAMVWLSRTETVALGWTLLHFCWQGAVLASVYAVLDRITSRARPSVRYLVAICVLALMPLAVVSTFAIEMRDQASAAIDASAALPISAPFFDVTQDAVARELPAAFLPVVKQPRLWFAEHLEPELPWVDDIWMVGVVLLALRAMGGWLQLEMLRKRARRMVPPDIQRQFQQMCERMRMGRQMSLRISDEVISPLAMGIWRATVILPISSVLRMPPSELEAVLAHELAHIRRWDYLCNLLQTAVESVLFFHPAVWWVSRTVRERREVCCDEIAVGICADPVVYAQALLRLEEEKTKRMELAMAFRGSNGLLLKRVTQVLEGENTMESKMTGGMRIAVAGVLVVGLLLGPKVRNAVAAPIAAASYSISIYNATPLLGASAQATPSPSSNIKPAPGTSISNELAMPSAAPVAMSHEQEDPSPAPTPASDVAAVAAPIVASAAASVQVQTAETAMEDAQAAGGSSSMKVSTYIEGMRAAGYPLDLNNDLNTLIAMKSLGVTPEYARAMGAAGLGKPSVHELITLKSLGVTPEYVSTMKQSGLGPKDFHEAVTEKALGITPEYAAAIKQAGFGNLSMYELIGLKAQGMTPEYAQWLKQQFPQIAVEQMKRAAVFHIDEKFLADAKAHGFDGKDLEKLLRLKISGLLDE
jgi:beta-lactamase regulating signal transducer with metallopeptidase domain